MPLGLKYFCVLFYLLTYWFLFKRDRRLAVFFPVAFSTFPVFVSLIMIESGAYVIEQGRSGYENGAFAWFFLFAETALIAAYFGVKLVGMKFNPSADPGDLKKYNLLFVVYLAMLLYAVSRNPNFTRFDIYDGLEYKRFFYLADVVFFAGFVYYMLRAKTQSRRIYILLLFFITNLLKGTQFSGYSVGLMWFMIAHVLHGGKFSMKAILWLLLAVAVFIGYKASKLEAGISLYDRFVLQGHVFWGGVDLVQRQGANPDLSEFFAAFFNSDTFSGNINYGFGKLMHAISGNRAKLMLDMHIRFTVGYPMVLIYHFDFALALLLHVLATIVYMGMFALLFKVIDSFGLIIFLLFYRVFGQYEDFYQMGEFGYFNFKYLLTVVFVLLAAATYNTVRNFRRDRLQAEVQP